MSEVIRVLHCFERMNRGGAESFAMNIYRGIDKEKVQFDFLVSGEGAYDDEIRELGGRLYYIPPLLKIGPIRFQKELYKFFQNDKEHRIIHSHRNKVSGIILRQAAKAGIPVRISHSHTTSDKGNFVIKLLKNYFRRYVNKYSTCKIACGIEAAKYLYDSDKDVTVVKNGICSKKYIFDSTLRDEKRMELNINGKFVVGTVGRLETVKNHSFLIDVFDKIQSEHKNSLLIIVGIGELKQNILCKAEKLGLEDKVIILENRPDVNELLQAMDVFVMPSFYEGVPLSVIEAQCSGLKCFLSDGISPEVKITDNVEFLSLESGAEVWARKILADKEYLRCSQLEDIKSKGYDIIESTKILEKLYCSYN